MNETIKDPVPYEIHRMIRLLLAALCSVAALPALAAPRCERDALDLVAKIDAIRTTPQTINTGDDRKAERYPGDAGELIIETRDDGRTRINYYSSGDTLRYARSFGTVQQGKRVVAHTARLSWSADGKRCDGARFIRGQTARLDASAFKAFVADWQTLRQTPAAAPMPAASKPASPIRDAKPVFVAPGEAAPSRGGWR
ncbi:hypothetical protein JHS3_29910 [Jeongeupia sp. HS-3]|uniref:hypothetical protein n=1 Tax=Jeongeupia sp. HS-3 TaxID=1009682 RepID=UPI0018A64E9E|nr:hypothetical protein [Jeongeupia sp. HS-3]BCL77255.1 hypothetical protein JHS3_29910 [Jeongeupia sp. HS-3]